MTVGYVDDIQVRHAETRTVCAMGGMERQVTVGKPTVTLQVTLYECDSELLERLMRGDASVEITAIDAKPTMLDRFAPPNTKDTPVAATADTW